MTYAVKTVVNLFTCCGHERYTMMMENEIYIHNHSHIPHPPNSSNIYIADSKINTVNIYNI